MMAEPKLSSAATRVVPSGQVYRQLFDAQVQLHKSLSNVGRKTSSRIITRGQSAPVVPGKELTFIKQGVADLGSYPQKSRTWANAFPSEPDEENVDLYKKFYMRTAQAESITDIQEVKALPDVIVPAKRGSDIIERITARRKERHEAAIEDMMQELSVLNTEIEPNIVEQCEVTMKKLQADDEEIAKKMAKIEKDEDLMEYSLDALCLLWDDIQSHTSDRQQWIQDLDDGLQKLEEGRMEKITQVFQTYSRNLEKIAYLMAPDLHRFLDKEAQLINQTLLSNRRAYADLYTRLMSSDIEREKTQHALWCRRVEDWKNLKIDLAVEKFKDYMESPEIIKPPGVEQVLQFMISEEEMQNAQRLELVESLMNLTPPSSTKTAMYKWNEDLNKASKELSDLLELHMTQLHRGYEKVCQACLGEIEKHKNSLIESGAATANKAQSIVDSKMLPLLGERQRIFEGNLETMEKRLEVHSKQTIEELKSLFKFAQGAAHVWDLHEIGLAKRERELQEKLEASRHEHNGYNQEKEANLDIIMDKMRQEAGENSLRDALNKVNEMLKHIKQSYYHFHEAQVEIVKCYPSMVKEELEAFDDNVCKFFMVNRTHPDEMANAEQEPAEVKEEEKLSTPLSTRSTGRSSKRSSRKSKGTPAEEEVKEQPLPMAVAEVLQTGKGTTFYVLTVAGEHGPDPVSTEDTTEAEKPTEENLFLTETKSDESMPDYINSMDIPTSLLQQVKNAIRLNFLNHLENWSSQAMDRSSCVVVAKTEELNNELDLRLHLHEPRSRRAELDVHNVRAAEIVLHSERVSRHVKGMHRALTDLSKRFRAMNHEHNNWATRFREDIEALEIVFINATKSSRLVALQNQISVELDKFMSNIRTSLREFRQHLDGTLQMLRESNARFIKSFKLFSDGGNFCPEEIDEYRKELEKLSKKIDQAEGAIMSDLEGMESKRLEQATKVASEFEDRFKNHMIDLIFMEKMARLMTNTQVRVKAEVAESNSQSQRLAIHLESLEARIDACERPNLDKEDITPTELNASLKKIFEAFHYRSCYLNCLKSIRPPSVTVPPSAGPASRVGFVDGSKGSKQEDPCIGMIKSIQKRSKQKQSGMRFGSEADFDGDTNPQASAVNLSAPPTADSDKLRASHSTAGAKSPFSDRSGRRDTMSQIYIDKRTQSALRRGSKPASKFEKKYLVFGEKEEDGEDRFLLGKIRRILREALDALLTRAEMYYRQKGNRQVTRPQVLQETFDQCAEIFTQKLEFYYQQAEDYHNQCLQEFRAQLTQLETLMARVPPLVTKEIVDKHIQTAQTSKKDLEDKFVDTLKELDKRQKQHDGLLRPTLGHPDNEDQLKNLADKETVRHSDYDAAVDKQTKDLQANLVKCAEEFMTELLKVAEQQLLQYDQLLVVDDVQKGRVEPTLHKTSELIRRKNAGKPLQDLEDLELIPRGPGSWTGVPANELVAGDKPEKVHLTSPVNTAKTTMGHRATVKARDAAYMDYKAEFEKSLASMATEKGKLLDAEQRWYTYWNKSLQRVKELYE